jgi:hypothetical protein
LSRLPFSTVSHYCIVDFCRLFSHCLPPKFLRIAAVLTMATTALSKQNLVFVRRLVLLVAMIAVLALRLSSEQKRVLMNLDAGVFEWPAAGRSALSSSTVDEYLHSSDDDKGTRNPENGAILPSCKSFMRRKGQSLHDEEYGGGDFLNKSPNCFYVDAAKRRIARVQSGTTLHVASLHCARGKEVLVRQAYHVHWRKLDAISGDQLGVSARTRSISSSL